MYEINLFSEEKEINEIPLKDADVRYYRNFLKAEKASELFKIFMEETPWREDDIKVFGKVYKQPRLTALYGNNGKEYSYSGIHMNPIPFTPVLDQLRQKIESVTSHSFSTVLLNLYRNGQDSNGWHSDDEKELGKNPVIASISLGAKRYFHLKYKHDKKETYKILLEHGSLLLMAGATQENWWHQIPKTKKQMEPRINLTFRLIK